MLVDFFEFATDLIIFLENGSFLFPGLLALLTGPKNIKFCILISVGISHLITIFSDLMYPGLRQSFILFYKNIPFRNIFPLHQRNCRLKWKGAYSGHHFGRCCKSYSSWICFRIGVWNWFLSRAAQLITEWNFRKN